VGAIHTRTGFLVLQMEKDTPGRLPLDALNGHTEHFDMSGFGVEGTSGVLRHQGVRLEHQGVGLEHQGVRLEHLRV